MRTIEEIVEEARRVKKKEFDIFSTIVDLVEYLPYEHAKEFLKEEVTKEEWGGIRQELNEDDILRQMKDYMSHATDKAINHRGISASGSIDHYQRWLWLLGDDELLGFLRNGKNYQNYGAPMLKKIALKYNIPWPDDKGINNMAEGKECYPGCMMGCGR